MEAIGTLAGGIAHDFNNILSPIIMYTEIALRDLQPDNALRPYMEQVLKSSRRPRICQTGSDHQPPDRTSAGMVQLTPMVKESLKLLRASLPATIDIRQEILSQWIGCWPIPPKLSNYYESLHQCRTRHGEPGGVLTVGLDNVELPQEQTTFGINVKPGKYLRLSIRDTGCGMSPEVMDRIFEPYFTTKGLGQEPGWAWPWSMELSRTAAAGSTLPASPEKGPHFKSSCLY